MYIGTLDNKQLISITLMILFALGAMLFIGYQLAYTKAISYANEQIDKEVNNFKMMYGIQEGNPDFLLGNMDYPDFGGTKDEE